MGASNSSQQAAREKIVRMYRVNPPPDASPRKNSLSVVLADDDPSFRTTLKRVMETRGGFRIQEARNGEEAVRLASELRPDAILMDLAMPRINGLEATRIIKTQQPKTRIIVCSVHNESVYVQAAFDHGADAFMVKSKCFSELESLKKLVEEGQA